MVPVAWAAASVWQPAQPAFWKIDAPAAGSPLSFDAGVTGAVGAAASVPTTVTATGLTVPSEPQAEAMSTTASEKAIRIARRTRRDSTWPHYHVSHEAEVVRTRRRAHPPDAFHDRLARPALRRLRARALLRPERRARADARDHRGDRRGAVLDVGQGGARGLRREDRHPRGGAGAARDDRRHARPPGPARAAGGRSGARARALARREPRRPDHDARELLRDARGADHPLRLLLRDVRRLRRRQPKQPERRQ